ncbi:hypothetical protein ACEPAI_7981 [Sanghuangporus weigelae]
MCRAYPFQHQPRSSNPQRAAEIMRNKESKARPSMLTRSLSYAFGGSRHNGYQHPSAPQPHFHGLPPGPPPCIQHAYGHGRHLSCSDFPRPRYYASSLRSTTATASDTQDPPSLVSNGTSSGSSRTSSHYSGFNSAVYSPQQAYGPADTPPYIHSLLDATSASLIWDVRTKPKELQVTGSATQIISPHVLSFPLIANASDHICIISPDFPWSIEIGPKQHGITSSEVLHALYDLLNSDLEDSIWSLADERKRSSILRAWKRRSDSGSRIKKADWLGKYYMFRGFYRDAGFKQRLLRPDAADVPETLLVAFGKA